MITPYHAWCDIGNDIKIDDRTNKCARNTAFTTEYLGTNIIHKYDRKTGVQVGEKILEFAGHGQSGDVTANNTLYLNYFSNTKLPGSSENRIGASDTGVAILNGIPNEVGRGKIYPNTMIKINSAGSINKFTSTNTPGSSKYNSEVITQGKKDPMYFTQVAVDEKSKKVVVFDPTIVNGNRAFYIYDMDKFNKGTPKHKKYHVGKICGTGQNKKSCGGQGIEISGDYIYFVQDLTVGENKYAVVTKIKYNEL